LKKRKEKEKEEDEEDLTVLTLAMRQSSNISCIVHNNDVASSLSTSTSPAGIKTKIY